MENIFILKTTNGCHGKTLYGMDLWTVEEYFKKHESEYFSSMSTPNCYFIKLNSSCSPVSMKSISLEEFEEFLLPFIDNKLIQKFIEFKKFKKEIIKKYGKN